MAYAFKQIEAHDPNNPGLVAPNASVTIFEPGDPTKTPLTLTTIAGDPLPNPVTVNGMGYGPAFMHATLPQVAWSGGGLTGTFESYEGMRDEAIAARTAAETAAATAGADAAAVADAAIGDATAEATAAKTAAETAASNASVAATAAANSAALVGAPADTAIAAAINGTGTATKTALNATYAPIGDLAWLARGKLDIWPAFNANGGAGSWDSLTYSSWIAGIDANLAGEIASGAVTKVDHGPSSDATRNIYAYTAGAANAPHALIVGGQHANERLSQVSAMRWFEQFAKGTHPAMRALRQALRVTWIPTQTPSGYYSTRDNANGINVNRNYDHLWQYFVTEPKGAAPFDQPEAAVVKKIIDQNGVSAVIDCHTTTMTSPNAILFDSPSRMLAVRRDTAFGAGAVWNQVYSDGTVPCEPYHLHWDSPMNPVLTHWAPRYMTYALRRENAGAVTVESPEPFMGGSFTNFTRPAIQMYCGYITLWLVQWLLTGQTPATPRPYEWAAGRQSWDDTAALGGGASLNGSSITPNGSTLYMPFDFGVATAGQKYVDFFAPMPGKFYVNWHGSVENAGAVGGSVSVNTFMNPREDASPTAQVQGYVTFEVPAGAGKRAAASSGFRYSVTQANANKIHRLQIGLIRNFADNTLYARRFYVSIRFVPDDLDGIWELPVV